MHIPEDNLSETSFNDDLMALVRDMNQEVNIEVMQDLVENKGANVNSLSHKNKWSILMYATTRPPSENTTNIIKYLVSHGADIHYENDFYSVLSRGSMEHGKEVLETLIDDETTTLSNLRQSLDLAISFENHEAKDILQRKIEEIDKVFLKKISTHDIFKDNPDAQEIAFKKYKEYEEDGSSLNKKTLLNLNKRINDQKESSSLSQEQYAALWEIVHGVSDDSLSQSDGEDNPTTSPVNSVSSVGKSDIHLVSQRENGMSTLFRTLNLSKFYRFC